MDESEPPAGRSHFEALVERAFSAENITVWHVSGKGMK